ncbi:MAG: 3-hydroxybutyrate dehydrogenase, partial [Comamonadaceae bacterium]
ISVTQAQNELLGEKQPSLQFTSVEQLGGLAVFLASPAADQVRGVAWAMDGGWTAQ